MVPRSGGEDIHPTRKVKSDFELKFRAFREDIIAMVPSIKFWKEPNTYSSFLRSLSSSVAHKTHIHTPPMPVELLAQQFQTCRFPSMQPHLVL